MKTLRTVVCLLSPCLLSAAAGDDAKNLPAGSGREAVARICIDCHGAANFRKYRLSKDVWSEKVDDMVERGAKGTDDELDTIVDYLAKNFGPDSKVGVNTAPLEELKYVLGLTVPEAQAVIAYRGANGAFHSLQDLKNVPGVDFRKFEAGKDKLQF
jgi:competence protein ComEA